MRANGLAYGGIGLLLGSLVRGELEGFFLIIMLSLVDTGLQNPVFNTLMDVAGVSALPLYGVHQLALSSALTPHIPWSHGLLSLTWSAATGALALLVLDTHRPSRPPVVPQNESPDRAITVRTVFLPGPRCRPRGCPIIGVRKAVEANVVLCRVRRRR
ncbi:hypothetical protein [Streptomyces sp. Ag82_O1-15]|uniref:hypothetical protein n=1 Tax=Streptomyces sp. Ag82_O1-15 TaxID=1938855 RepID=UPI000BB161D7|nr:hypothetical protein [Streptomyces sp. Ag82_O1-15]